MSPVPPTGTYVGNRFSHSVQLPASKVVIFAPWSKLLAPVTTHGFSRCSAKGFGQEAAKWLHPQSEPS